MSLLVPDTSYSSSEGEDDFYDADDEPAELLPAPRLVFTLTTHTHETCFTSLKFKQSEILIPLKARFSKRQIDIDSCQIRTSMAMF